MQKELEIGSQTVTFRASALIPRIYRYKFGRDLIADMRTLQKSYLKIVDTQKNADNNENENAQFSVLDLTIFENVAWVMAKHGSGDIIPDTPDEWLDSIDGVFSIYQILPAILELWNVNSLQTSRPKKK